MNVQLPLGRMQQITLDLVTQHPGETLGELIGRAEKAGVWSAGGWNKKLRTWELEHRGLITKKGKRKNPLTGRPSDRWYPVNGGGK